MNAPTAYCQHCGQPITAASRFCHHCGQPQPTGSAAESGATPAPAPAPPAPYGTASHAAAVPAAAVTVQYAGFWMRFLAVVIDGLVVGVITAPVTIIMQVAAGLHGGLIADKPEINAGNIAMIAALLAGVVTFSIAVHACYEAFLTASSKQATVGKMVFRIKVTDLAGRRISIARGFGRHFAKYVSSLTLAIGYLIQPFTERRQALHDIIAGTLVVREVGPPYQIVPPQPTQPGT